MTVLRPTSISNFTTTTLTSYQVFFFSFSVWGTVITVISILCCIACCLIPLCNSKEEKNGRVLNQNQQLQQVVTSKAGVPLKWDGRTWVPASRAEVQSSQIQHTTHTIGGYNGGYIGYSGGYDEGNDGGYSGGYSGGYDGGCSSGGGGGDGGGCDGGGGDGGGGGVGD